jgi:U2 small nuclear ribonucleoprotein A'
MGVKSRVFDTASANGTIAASTAKKTRVQLTDTERKKVQEMIKNAKTLEDIIRLEKQLNEGRVPTEAMDDAMMG